MKDKCKITTRNSVEETTVDFVLFGLKQHKEPLEQQLGDGGSDVST